METRSNREMEGDRSGDKCDRALVLLWLVEPRKRQARGQEGQEGQVVAQLLAPWERHE